MKISSLKRHLKTLWLRSAAKIQHVWKDFIVDFHGLNNTIVIVGSPRSGTTWISNLINFKNEYRYIFEPFRYRKGLEYIRDYPLFWYIPSGANNQEYRMLFRKILSGRVDISKYNQKHFTNRRLIKSICAHFFLRWMVEEFSTPLIFILRHPLAVTASRIRFQEKDPSWIPDFGDILRQDLLMQHYLEPFRPLIENASSDFDKHLLYTCVQNYVALEQLTHVNHLFVYYEDVVNAPMHELNRIYRFLNKSITASDRRKIEKMVSKRFMESEKNGKISLAKWKTQFTGEQLARAEYLMKTFRLDQHYTIQQETPARSNLSAA